MLQLLEDFKYYLVYSGEEIDPLHSFCVPDVSF